MNHLLMYCRQGFEKECVAEIQALLAAKKHNAFCKAKENSGYVMAHLEGDTAFAPDDIKYSHLIFARQLIICADVTKDLPESDRATPLAHALAELFRMYKLPQFYSELFVETADTNDAKELTTFCKSFSRPMEIILRKNMFEQREDAPRVHVMLMSAAAAVVGFSLKENSNPWPMGIARLRFPSAAPSRATLKLDEAFQVFLKPFERDAYLKPGLTAVDLGAAPGGWTYQFVKREIAVIAVDNAKMDESLLKSGFVKAVAQNGLVYTPKEAVQWMVCDVVDSPTKIAKVAARWIGEAHAKRCIVTLKLPMKKRIEEVRLCLEIIRETLAARNVKFTLKCKQLYHNREEVTVYLARK